MRASPYIGITGFMRRQEIEACLAGMPENSERKLMAGILASSKTISGERNSLIAKYPRREDVHKIPLRHKRVFNCLHFNSEWPERLYNDLILALEYSDDLIDGIQLNLSWPDPKVLSRIKNQYPRIKFILQISPHLAGYHGLGEWKVAEKIKSTYGDLASYALIDFSRGQGKSFSIENALPYLQAISKIAPNCKLAIAGALRSENLFMLQPLLQEFPELSFDAESKLRDDSAGGGKLIIQEALDYLHESRLLFPTVAC